MAPVSGAIFRVPQADRDANVCDKSAKPAISGKNHLPTGISHTKMRLGCTHQEARAHWGEFLQSIGDGQHDLAWNRQCAARLLPVPAFSRFTIGRKERMQHRKVDSTISVGNRRGKGTVAKLSARNTPRRLIGINHKAGKDRRNHNSTGVNRNEKYRPYRVGNVCCLMRSRNLRPRDCRMGTGAAC